MLVSLCDLLWCYLPCVGYLLLGSILLFLYTFCGTHDFSSLLFDPHRRYFIVTCCSIYGYSLRTLIVSTYVVPKVLTDAQYEYS